MNIVLRRFIKFSEISPIGVQMRLVSCFGTIYVTRDGRVHIYIRAPFDELFKNSHGKIVIIDVKIPETREEEHILRRVIEKLSGRS